MKNILFLVLAFALVGGGCDASYEPQTAEFGDVITEDTYTPPAEEISQENVENLQGQNLSKIPDSVFKKTNLEELNASYNQIDGAVQAEIRHLVNLRRLDLSDNNMTGVPAEIGQLQKLEYLDLSNNKLTGLPHQLGNLHNLKTLIIAGNDYSEGDLKVIMQKLPPLVKIKK